MNEQDILISGVGRKLVFLGHAADMISASLSSTYTNNTEYAIHIMARGAVFYQGKQFTSTEEIFEHKTGHEKSVFEEKTEKLLSIETDFVLQEIAYDSCYCLSLIFNHELVIRSFYNNFSKPDDEQWRVFFPWKAENSLVCKGGGIELEQSDYSQEELDRIRFLLHHKA